MRPRRSLAPDAIAQRLKAAIASRRMTLQEVSDEAGVAVSTLSSILSGRRKGWRLPLDVAERLARTLFISMDYLVGRWPETQQPPPPDPDVPRHRQLRRGRTKGNTYGLTRRSGSPGSAPER